MILTQNLKILNVPKSMNLERSESVEHFKKELIEYLSWYNEKRIKVKLKGLTPLQFRNQSLKSA